MRITTRKAALMERENAALNLPATATVLPTITLDYPQEGEEITGTNYTLRVGAPSTAESVEVSINQGPWHACRHASGYWWHDWTGYEDGPYQARARMRVENVRVVATLPTRFHVFIRRAG